MATLTDSEFEQLSEKVKSCIWVIKTSCSSRGQTVVKYATGFSIQDDAGRCLLMTCARCFCEHFRNENKKEIGCSVDVRQLHDQGFTKAEVVKINPSWDLVLLSEGNLNMNEPVVGEFVDDVSIRDYQPLVQVGHSIDLVGSVFVGHACFKCVNTDDGEYMNDNTPCGRYESDGACVTPNYRKLGDILDIFFFQEQDKLCNKQKNKKSSWINKVCQQREEEKLKFEKQMCAKIPVIQSAGLSCSKGCSGGPVFDIQGKIVGMMVGERKAAGFQIVLHVSLLKRFLDESESEGASKGGGTSKGASERPLKKIAKGKAPM